MHIEEHLTPTLTLTLITPPCPMHAEEHLTITLTLMLTLTLTQIASPCTMHAEEHLTLTQTLTLIASPCPMHAEEQGFVVAAHYFLGAVAVVHVEVHNTDSPDSALGQSRLDTE